MEPATPAVRFEQEDALGVLTVDNPPLNLMSDAVIAGFEDAINAIEPAPIRALLIRTQGPHFMVGADVLDLGLPRRARRDDLRGVVPAR